jgi:Domain of unknown function (DUF5666)
MKRINFCPGALCCTAVLLAGMLLAAGCGTSGMSSNPPGGTGGPMSAAQIKIGDAPADRVISLEVSAGPIAMTPTSGSLVTVLSSAHRIELTHLSGTNEPLALLNVPQGTYTSMTITVANPEVTFIDSSRSLVKLEPPFNQVVTINFSPALNVGGSASVVNIDLNLANALTFDVLGNVTGVKMGGSSFTVSTSAIAAENDQEAHDGELEDTTGTVTSVSGTSFTMSLGQNGVSLTFATDANTEFGDKATLGSLLNMIVRVEGRTRADGSLYAKEVEGVENEGGAEMEGVVTQVVGNPASQLALVAQDGSGRGMDDTKVGNSQSVTVSAAHFGVHQGSIDASSMGGLPSSPNFQFDATTIHAGQRVDIESATVMAANITAEKVELEQQALTGTVSGLAGATSVGPVTFTLSLPTDSAFAMLSGTTSVTVFWQPGTNLHNLNSVNNGDAIRVRGLVFFGGSNVNMIASRIDQ